MAVLNHGIISSAPEEAEEAAEFSVDSSLKFDGSSELLRAISTAGSLTTFTIAFWVKRGELGTRQVLFSSSNPGGNDQFWTEFSSDNRFRWLINNGDNTVDADMYSTRVFRDPSAWYHIAILVDTTAGTGNRMKLYVNGELETQTGTEISSSYNVEWNDTAYAQYIGDWAGGSIQFDGYLADVYHIDGQVIAPLGNFIETSETTGQLIPKEYTGGHYGTNGFHLNLSEGHDSEILINSAHREGSVNFEDSSGSDHNDLISYQNGDVSGNDPQHSIRAGNPFTGTDRAIYLDGTGDYLSAPHSSEFNFGTGDFTLESWVNTGDGTSSSNFGIMGHIESDSGQDGWLWWVDSNGSMKFFDSESGGNIYSPDGTFSSAIENRWNHVAAVRKSGVIYLYLNGDVVGSGANTETLDHTRTLTAGRSYENIDSYYFTGYMYDTRIVKGTAVYDAFTDLSSSEHAITPAGNVKHSTKTHLGNGSVYFDGTGDYLNIPDSEDFNMGSGDFTVECWINPDDVSTGQSIFSQHDNQGGDATGSFALYLYTDGKIYPTFYDSANATSYHPAYSNIVGVTVSAGEWAHIAYTRSGTDLKLYKDGVLAGTTTLGSGAVINNSTKTFTIGRAGEYPASYYNGYLDDFRISKGTAVYTAAFTAPTAPLSSTGSVFHLQSKGRSFDRPTEKLTDISGTSLLIQPDDDDAAVADRTETHTITNNNISLPATASTPYESVMKRSAIRFQCEGTSASQVDNAGVIMTGGSGYVTHSDFQLTTNETYTAEAWVYIEAIPFSVYTALFGNWSNNQNGWLMETWLDSGTNYWAFYDSASSVGNHVKTSTEVVLDKWHHVAVVKYSGNTGDTSIYLNGVRIEDSFQSNSTGGGIFSIGNYENGYNTYGLKGYMYDVRFTKGVTRYTGTTYDVPENPFVTGKLTHPGADSSGKKNHFDVEGHAGWDVVGDSPGPGKNYATLSPLVAYTGTLSEGNLKFVPGSSSATNSVTPSTIGIPAGGGKYYAEACYSTGNNMPVGINKGLPEQYASQTGIGYWTTGIIKVSGSSTQTGLATASSGDVVGIAVDLSGSPATVQFYVNGNTVGNSEEIEDAYTSGWDFIHFCGGNYVTSQVYLWNFGQDPTFSGTRSTTPATAEFAYAPPTDFKSLCTANLPAPGLNNAVASEQVFTAVTWEGDGSSSSDEVDVPANFNPDLIWAKQRTTDPQQHTLIDSGRGIGAKVLDTASATGQYEGTGYGVIQNNTTGFEATSGMTGGYSYFNVSGEDYVAWLWKKSAAAGFDIVTWEGDESEPSSPQPRTVDYSLGNSPAEMIIAKDFLGNTNWWVYHKDLTYNGNSPHSTAILLNENYQEGDFDGAMSGTGTTGIWGDTAPGNTSFTVKDDSMSGYSLNTPPSSSQDNYVAYCFRSIDGHSKVGSYAGNSSTNGTFIYCGFRPAYVIIKVISTASDWTVLDTTRDPHNYADRYLLASDTQTENQASTLKIDFLSNGLKLRGDGTGTNTGNTYIFYAVAENPFKYASAR